MPLLLELLKVQAGALVGALLGLLVSELARRTRAGRRPRRWAGVVLIGGLVGAFLAQYGLPSLPFGEDRLRSHERLFWMLVPGLLIALAPWRHALVALALVLPLVLVGMLTGWSLEPADLTPRLLLPLGLALLVASGDLTFRRRAGLDGALQLGLVQVAAAAAIGATGSASYATWAGGLGLAWGLCVLLAWRRGNAGELDGAGLLIWTGGLLLMAVTYSELAPLDALLIAGALPLSLLVEGFTDEEHRRRMLGWVSLLVPIALALLRIGLAWESDPYA